MKIALITQARLGSSRFPNKIIKKIDSNTVLEIHLMRLKNSKLITEYILATTFEKKIDQIKSIAKKYNFHFFQGSTDDVLDRFYRSVEQKNIDYIVRVTSDCPLIDGSLIDEVIKFTIENKLDYASNILEETFPDGQDIEVFTKDALKVAWEESTLQSYREHVTLFIRDNSSFNGGSLFKSKNFYSTYNYGNIRMTVDEKEDLKAIKLLIKNLGMNSSWKAYSEFIINNNKIFSNQNITRNEGLKKSNNNEQKK